MPEVKYSMLAASAVLLTATLTILWRQRQKRHGRKSDMVLCFGDSLTEGYHGVWRNARNSPKSNEIDALREVKAVKLHPYCIFLGECLADAANDFSPQRRARYAAHRAWSNWTTDQLLPMLRREINAGPWRCCVILAGSNDILLGHPPSEVLERIRALWKVCDEQSLPVVVIPNPPAELWYHGWTEQGDESGKQRAKERSRAMAELSRLVEAAAVEEGRAVTPIMKQVGNGLEFFFDDALHLSPAGSDEMGWRVFSTIQTSDL